MPTTAHHFNVRRVAPLRVLQRLLWRFRHAKAPSLATDVMDEALGTQEAELKTAVAESVTIDNGLAETRRLFTAALTDPVTPGIITTEESAHITRVVLATSITATTHRETLAAML